MRTKRTDILRWAVFTSGTETRPQASTFYRVAQMTGPLKKEGHELIRVSVEEHSPRSLRMNFDGVIVQKRTPGAGFWLGLKESRLPVVYDVDDAVWIGSGLKRKGMLNLARKLHRVFWAAGLSQTVTCANRLIARYPLFRGKACVVPMALDPVTWVPKANWAGEFVVGWAGAPSNASMLKGIEGAIDAFLSRNPKAKFVVCSGQRPEVRFPYEFVPYSDDVLPQTVRRFSVGLVPLHNNYFSKRKSPIKALQYMASSIPFVASRTPGLEEMVGGADSVFWAEGEHDWFESLSALKTSMDYLPAMGRDGRGRFDKFYTLNAVAKRLGHVLNRAHMRHNLSGRGGRGDQRIFNEVTRASFPVFG